MDDHYIDIGDGDTFTLAPDPAPMVPQHLLKPSSGRYLSPMERATIMVADRQGQSVWSIAAMLGRAPSTISRELRRKRRHWMPRYHAWQPQLWAESRTIRPQPRKLEQNERLLDAVWAICQLDIDAQAVTPDTLRQALSERAQRVAAL
ncbi:protein of unknown function [Microbacterium sp. Nx66]|uniref:helix-turn-helix domain-containing protein n=1 Tax=Microbacterium sp. Nx66 TaxID=2766784 RepID=UPI001657264C|nr:protein of unknown function [Microbacterium sp. Nx66]